MILRKIGVLLAIALAALLQVTSGEPGRDETSSESYIGSNSFQHGRDLGNSGLDDWRNYPQNGLEGSGGNSQEEMPAVSHIIREYLLQRDPQTGILKVVKVNKLIRDKPGNEGQVGWRELVSRERTDSDKMPPRIAFVGHSTHETEKETPNENIHVKKQLNETDYAHTRLGADNEGSKYHDLNRSAVFYNMFRKSIPAVRGSVWVGTVQGQDNAENDNGGHLGQMYRYPLNAGIYRRKAAMCIAKGNPEGCKNILQMAIYLQSILNSQNALMNHHVGGQLTEGERESAINSQMYLRMLLNILNGRSSDFDKYTEANENKNVLLRFFNFWNNLFKENANDTQAAQYKEHEDKENAVDKFIKIWDDFIHEIMEKENGSPAEENTPDNKFGQHLMKKFNETIISSNEDIKKRLKNIGDYVINIILDNGSTPENNETTQKEEQVIDDIERVCEYILREIFLNNSTDYKNFNEGQFLHRVKNVTEFVLMGMFGEQNLFPVKDRNMLKQWKAAWDFMWNILFSQLDYRGHAIRIGDGYILRKIWQNFLAGRRDNEVRNSTMQHPWQSILSSSTKERIRFWEIIWKNFLSLFNDHDKESSSQENRNTEENNSEPTAVIDKIAEEIKSHLNMSWEEIFNHLFTKIDELSGIYNKSSDGNVSNHVIEENQTHLPEEDKNNEKITKLNHIFENISDTFDEITNQELGTEEDNNWEDLLHNILNSVNEVRDPGSKDDEKGLWGYLEDSVGNNGEIKNKTSAIGTDKPEEQNDIWRMMVNRVLGTGSEINADLAEKHGEALDYIQQWIEDYASPIIGKDEIWRYLRNGTDTNTSNENKTNSLATVSNQTLNHGISNFTAN